MRLFPAVLFSVLLASGSSAFADTITAGAISSVSMNPASDSLSFSSASENVFPSGTFTQSGTFTIGDSEIPNQVVPFSFTDQISADGVSKSLVFTGQDSVTTTQDVLSINGLGPVNFGNLVLTFNPVTFGSGSMGSFPVTLTASASAAASPTPEPSSLALLGTCVLGVGLLSKRLRA